MDLNSNVFKPDFIKPDIIDSDIVKSDSMMDALVGAPSSLISKIIVNTLFVALGSFLLVLSAQVIIPLPFTPVPITAQGLGVLVLGSLLGSRRAPLAVLLYIFYGLIGFPVFSLGLSGASVLFGATGGYLLGFVFASYFVGKLSERGWDRSFLKSLSLMLVGQVFIFIPGLLWLIPIVGLENVLDKGLYPFLLGGIIKVLLGALTTILGWKAISQFKRGLRG